MGGSARSNILVDAFSVSRTKGSYAGVSLEGSAIKKQDKWNADYYGKAVRPVDILAKHSVSNPGSVELRTTVTNAHEKKKGD